MGSSKMPISGSVDDYRRSDKTPSELAEICALRSDISQAVACSSRLRRLVPRNTRGDPLDKE